MPLVTDMYVINNSGENKYYLTYQGNTMNVIEYLQNVLGLEPVVNNENDTKNQKNNNENSNDGNNIVDKANNEQ